MTLWQVLIVVAVAWISGALFGVGIKDLMGRGRKPTQWTMLAASLAARTKGQPPQTPSTEPAPLQAEAAEALSSPDQDPSQSGVAQSPATNEPRQRPHFWFPDDDPSTPQEPDAKTQEPDPAAPGPPATLATPAGSPLAETEGSLSETSQTEAPDAGALRRVRPIAEVAGAPSLTNTISSVRVLEREAKSGPTNGSKKHRHGKRTFSNQIAYWRAQDRKAQSEGLMFWVEAALLIALLIGASWGVVYFATQPVAGLR